MKFPVWAIAIGFLCLAAVFSAGIVAAPPLKVNKAKPLLLDEPKAAPKKQAEGPVADNSACHVCHTNYQEESLASVHAEADVGCVKCHGVSMAHRNDENNTTPPDKMYPAESIEPACVECHETHDAPARKVLSRWKERCPEKTDFSQVLCTDCHGVHRLKLRTVRWDKKTGKVLLGASARTPASGGYPIAAARVFDPPTTAARSPGPELRGCTMGRVAVAVSGQPLTAPLAMGVTVGRNSQGFGFPGGDAL